MPLTLSCRLAGAYAETLLSAGCRFTTQDAPSTRYSRASSASAAASMPAAVSRDKVGGVMADGSSGGVSI